MTLSDCITILTEHNKWRRGLPPYENGGEKTSYSVKELGQAIDYAISTLTAMNTMQDMHETMMPNHAYLIVATIAHSTGNPSWEEEFTAWYKEQEWLGAHRAAAAFISSKINEMKGLEK